MNPEELYIFFKASEAFTKEAAYTQEHKHPRAKRATKRAERRDKIRRKMAKQSRKINRKG